MELPDQAFESVEDFLESPRFQRWVRGEAPHDEAFWKEMLEQHPHKVPLYEHATAILLVIGGKNTAEIRQGNKVLPATENIDGHMRQKKPLPLWSKLRWAVAAVLIIAAGLWWQNSYQQKAFPDTGSTALKKHTPNQLVTKQNLHKETLLVNLPDGSSVLLSKGSSISYEQNMAGRQRVVKLTGEGFFEVVKDPRRPFLVYANKFVTTVVGTSFRIKSFPGSTEALVAVKTGKVFVSRQDDLENQSSRVTLLPNQQLQLFTDGEAARSEILNAIPAADMTPAQAEEFDFRFMPVTEAYKILESNYAVKIRYNRDKMRHCTLTASLKDEPFLEKLRLICLATETTYKIAGDEIFIDGPGCPD